MLVAKIVAVVAAVAEVVAVVVAVAETEADTSQDGLAVPLPKAVGEADAEAEAVALALGDGLGLGGASVSTYVVCASVLITTSPLARMAGDANAGPSRTCAHSGVPSAAKLYSRWSYEAM